MKIEKILDEHLRESFFKVSHPSGLDIFVYPKEGYSKKFAYFMTRYGALYNEFTNEKGEAFSLPPGVPHFLEHKIFEDEEKDIFQEFSKLGASVNAYTNYASTVYYFSTVKAFEPALKLLVDFVLTPHLTPENVEKEKGIITQEIRMYDDDPDWRAYFNGLKKMYQCHPMGEDIAGTEESVNGTTLEDLLLAYDHFYSPRNMALLVVGDLDPQRTIEYVDGILPETFLKKRAGGSLTLREEPLNPEVSEVAVTMGIPTPIFNYFIKGPATSLSPGDYKESMKIRIALEYLFGKGSKFFNEFYEKGLLNSTFGHEYSYGQGFSYLAFGGESRDPRQMASGINEALEAFKREGIEEAGFERIKRKILGRNISAFNSIQTIANIFIGHYIKGVDIFEGMRIVEAITKEDVEKSLGMTLKNRTILSIVQ
ncbi:MAG: hypothetical protein AVO33_02615 [delta proteobacterium ML8_F1]|nr:MAG: hypothetical protein AVO33_02615 [delta proteobacterium ML8_F1]